MTAGFADFARRFGRNWPAVAGVGVLGLVFGMAMIAPLLYPDSPWDMVAQPFLWPGDEREYWLGTDMLGRDLSAGIFHGARVSLLIGFVATLVAVFVGIAIGALAGYYGGWIDNALMRLTEVCSRPSRRSSSRSCWWRYSSRR
jgi:peptide/nickel transport system permease protein